MIEDFYDIMSRREEGGETVFHVALRPDCKVYEGHFPGSPVAPGVCNIQMIRECAEAVAGRPLLISKIGQCRMTKLITPGEFPELDVRVTLDGESLIASIESGETVCLTLKATIV
jgi:3-hydroxyacyl-[acyl-carrier-protein] dehydratase